MAKIDKTGITGTSLPEYVDALNQAFRTALGNTLDVDPQTPQGQIIGIYAQSLSNLDDVLIQEFAALDVSQASGQQLDSLFGNFGIFRDGATPAIVNCELTGVAGTIIPEGSKAATNLNDIFLCSQDVTIPASGQITVAFEAQNPGNLTVGIGDINTIVTPISGWNSINNTEAGIPGTSPQSDTDFRQKYFNTLSKNARGSNESTVASIYEASANSATPVIDVIAVDNDTSSIQTIQGVDINAHTLYCVVQGGEDTNTAQAIYITKPPGCGTQGDTTIQVPTNGGRLIKEVKFQKAELLNAFIEVEVKLSDPRLANPEGKIKDAVVSYVDSLKIAETLYKSLLYCPISSVGNAVVQSLTLGTTKGGADMNMIEPILYRRVVLNIADIEVTVVP